jgi:phage baseplate assembly protein V
MINLKNLIRVGKISSINYAAGRVRVVFPDQDSIVSDEIPYVTLMGEEYEMPDVGDQVLVIGLGSGLIRGFCLGSFFYSQKLPVQSGPNIYYKRFKKDALMTYNRATKTFTIKADTIVFDGNVQITGGLQVAGSASVGGDLAIGGALTTGGALTAGGAIDAAGDITTATKFIDRLGVVR